jgi:hypothetical protein
MRELSGSWIEESRQEAEAAGSLVSPLKIIDRSVKTLIRRAPPAFFRLAGIDARVATRRSLPRTWSAQKG